MTREKGGERKKERKKGGEREWEVGGRDVCGAELKVVEKLCTLLIFRGISPAQSNEKTRKNFFQTVQLNIAFAK